MTLLDLLPSLHNVARPRVDPAVWPVTTHLDEQGRMCVGETALSEIADQFRTPAYVLDEEDFRHRARRYRSTLREIEVAYAGKALLTADIARWVAQEGLSLDVCSSGELATALAGGFDPERIIMHGNAKTPDELSDAAAVGVGRIVVDSYTEIMFLATRLAKRQRVLVRVTPDIDIHGHAAVTTGVTDQKFGFPLHEGHAIEAARRVLDQPLLNLVGLHCHIGSQVTDCALYGETIRRMIAAMADIRARHGVILGELPRPRVVVEPGRAISARAGVTLYRVVSVKTQPGGRTFVAVDGGMSDNPRVSLYSAKYSVALANRHPSAPPQLVTVAGRHCESGDEIARDVSLPSDVRPGDVLAVACTGAYHHSMASSYNLVGRPPVVAVRDGRVRELVRRETIADLLSRDRGAR